MRVFAKNVWVLGGGGPKGVSGLGVPPRRKEICFEFEWLKWPILAEMKFGIYFRFLCQQGGISPLPPVLLAKTLIAIV